MTIKISISGGKKLSGIVPIHGAKNSVLELIPATLLTDEKVILKNVPNLKDVATILNLMQVFGADICWDKNEHTITIMTKDLKSCIAPYDIVKTMRASIYVLGALLGRCGQAKVSFPGGCVLGPRPIDLHIDAMKKLGANIEIINGDIVANVELINGKRQLIGAVIELLNAQGKTSHGGTVNTLLAAVLAKGQTVIKYASIEPEIDDLVQMLNLMGADILKKNDNGINTLVINGVEKLHGCEFSVMPDRIEALSYAVVGALCNGQVSIINTDTTKYEYALNKLKDAGVMLNVSGDKRVLNIDGEATLINAIDITTSPYPGFPTDALPQFMTMLALANGKSRVQENVLSDRFQCVPELRRMGAVTELDNKLQNVVYFTGVDCFSSARVMASDLRSGFALLIAGLVAAGDTRTEILRAYHIYRGYENFVEILRNLGADVEEQFYDE